MPITPKKLHNGGQLVGFDVPAVEMFEEPPDPRVVIVFFIYSSNTFDELREAVLVLVSGLSNRPNSEWRKIRCVIR